MSRNPERQLESLLSSHKMPKYAVMGLEGRDSVSLSGKMEQIYKEWIAGGYHGEMQYLEKHSGLKYHPEKILPGAKSIILLLLPYYQEDRAEDSRSDPAAWGRVARYAWGRDYHKVLKKKLISLIRDLQESFPQGEFRAFVDSGPLDERFYAVQAGMGHIGRNGLLITPEYGSWIFIGEIVTTIDFLSHKKTDYLYSSLLYQIKACPSGCRLCQKACPSGAIRPDGTFDATRCISYLTIEHKGAIPLELRPLISDHFFGCDICQDVCPLNRNIEATFEPDFTRHIAGSRVDISLLLNLRSRKEMVEHFAGSPLLRLGVDQMLRNALVVAGNSGDRRYLRQIELLTGHENPMVAEHALWALSTLKTSKD